MDNTDIRFSIITRVHNSQKYMRQCIESILSQTYKNWNLFLVDDGSTDSSPDICNEYAANDSRIRVISQENKGGAASQKAGMDSVAKNSSSSDEHHYVLTLDTDDWYDSDSLERIHDYLTKSPDIDCLIFGFNEFREDSSKSIPHRVIEENTVFDGRELVKWVMESSAFGMTKAIRRDLMDYTELESNLIEASMGKFWTNNDIFLYTPLMFNSKKSMAIRDCLFNCRILHNSMSRARNPWGRIQNSLDTMDYLHKVFEERSFLDKGEDLIFREVFREILPQLYLAIRSFDFDRAKIKAVKSNDGYKKLIAYAEKEGLIKTYSPCRLRMAFFIFTRVL